MEWQDEKEALLAMIRKQEQEATALAKRFKLLQQMLKEQQKLLDRYQRALSAAKTDEKTAPSIDKNSSRTSAKSITTTTENVKGKEHKPWMQKKTAGSSDLETIAEAPVPHLEKKKKKEAEAKKEEKKSVFKSIAKRRSGGLAATWAEEKRRMLKKPKWEQKLETVADSSPNRENIRVEQPKKGFAYVEVVRNREERKKLPAHDCIECKKYYDALGGLGAVDAAAQKNKCSRHRARFEPYETPDDFWRLSFPDSVPEPMSPSVL